MALSILAILSPAVFGGDLRRLAHVHLRGIWLPVVALLAQVVIMEVVAGGPRVLLESIHIATYIAAGAFIVWNWRVPGLWLIALGALSNGVTIALNGGTLPASAEATMLAGLHETPGQFINSEPLAHPVLPLLGDIFVWPAPLPLSNVFSIGDALIVFGAFYGANKICRSRLVRVSVQEYWDDAIALANSGAQQDLEPTMLG